MIDVGLATVNRFVRGLEYIMIEVGIKILNE